ncbi:MAG: M20/M25/M40 family metallo-hydrolase [Bacteroidota bacterium]
MKRPFFLIIIGLILFSLKSTAQVNNEDALYIRSIYDKALTEGQCYDWLTHIATKIGGRLAGSPQSLAAVEYTKQILDTLGMDSVWLQPCIVPHWNRGNEEQVRIVQSALGSMDLNALALGNSIGTKQDGIIAEVIEVQSLEEVEKLGATIKGKIVFYNRPMNPKQIRTFSAYGGAVDQRVYGASKAAKFGAVAVLVRSITTKLDDFPHTGTLVYKDGITKIPGLALSTNDAEKLSNILKKGTARIFIKTNCGMLGDKPSYNVIGEIKGRTHPNEIILVGGHLDSWDVGQGAHDDGAGCVHAMDVIQILKRLNYQPKRTIRCVLFMNEENGQGGAIAYMEASNKNEEYHLAAIESDAGGFTPRGFTADGDASIFVDKFQKVVKWLPLVEPYGLYLEKGGSGADISRLKSQKGLLFGFRPDSQRYFDYHHTAADKIEAVNQRELELGAASMTTLVYLLDKYGL